MVPWITPKGLKAHAFLLITQMQQQPVVAEPASAFKNYLKKPLYVAFLLL